jgi:hypothetical protein
LLKKGRILNPPEFHLDNGKDANPDPDWIRIQPDKNDAQKNELLLYCFKMIDVLFGGLEVSLLA